MRRLFPVVLAVLWSSSAFAVHFTGSQTGPTTWTYNLTIDPLDNDSVCQANTTITITGLSGVTAATPPTSTDIPSAGLAPLQLLWTPQVLSGGTTVVWTHPSGAGTGNFGSAFHINGFTITATAQPGIAPFATSGFARDGTCPTLVTDISGTVAAPTLTAAAAAPAMSPKMLALLALGLVLTAVVVLRR